MLSVISNNTTWFLLVWLCFDLYCSLIVFFPYGRDKILNAISSLFFSNVFQSFMCDGKFMFFQLYLEVWLSCFFDVLSGWSRISWWLSATVMAYIKHFLSSSLSFLGLILAFFYNHALVSIYVSPLIKSIWLNLISMQFL